MSGSHKPADASSHGDKDIRKALAAAVEAGLHLTTGGHKMMLWSPDESSRISIGGTPRSSHAEVQKIERFVRKVTKRKQE